MLLVTRIRLSLLSLPIISLLLGACTPPPATTPLPGLVKLDSLKARIIADSIRSNTSVQLADGLALSLWASDSLLADPVALYMDPQGRAYVSSTTRGNQSEFDIRGHVDWMTKSISFASVEDRQAFLHETFSADKSEENQWLIDLNHDSIHDWRDLAVEKERIIRIEDTDHDGVADQSHTFVEGFNTEISDVAGAFMGHDGDFFLGVAPDMWHLRDQNNDGIVDEMSSIVHGFQVHIGFGGHGMSGLTTGPDGKIYWSIGDIGFNITDQTGKQWAYPNQGAIFRANADGSDFEVFAAGLRNTHEFAFDAYGNLISVDNDGDYPGEMERLVYIVNGSDAGWRANWQYGKYTDPDNNRYNVWMEEEMFKPRFEGQAAYIVPPIQNYHSGPTGLKYQPGTALGGRWQNHFFVVEFPGAATRAKLHAFELQPDGAGFAMKQEEVIAQGVLATGLDISSDGALYFSDWITGWGPKGYGRIWKLDDQASSGSAIRTEVQSLLLADFQGLKAAQLVEHLGHVDKRIRQKAQFELAKRGTKSTEPFLQSINQTNTQLARVHGIWGLTQLIRQKQASADLLAAFLTDEDPEIRAQAAKMIGDVRYSGAGEQLMVLLGDPSPRVQFFAAEALGRTAHKPAIAALIEMLRQNDDQDVYLRHAGSLALARIGEQAPVAALASHSSKSLRIAAVVALRRMKSPALAAFLQDSDEFVVTEAARAIHDDYSVPEAMPALAEYLNLAEGFRNEALLRRVVSANSRLGRPEDLARLVQLCANRTFAPGIRAEAIATISVFDNPSVLDRVDGRLRGPMSRDISAVTGSIAPELSRLLRSKDPLVLQASIELIGKLGFDNYDSELFGILKISKDANIRKTTIEALSQLNTPDLPKAIRLALEDSDASVRSKALSLTPDLPIAPKEIVALLQGVIKRGTTGDRQAAISAMGDLPDADIAPAVESLLKTWEAGKLSADLQLELGEVIEEMEDSSLTVRVE
ncbi:MAG: HEAT repeat domain-containing protein, partial [Bacteroidia bacterium]|nr:HEAT repeat domain-containing protein [Bacteroidia bacterium]